MMEFDCIVTIYYWNIIHPSIFPTGSFYIIYQAVRVLEYFQKCRVEQPSFHSSNPPCVFCMMYNSMLIFKMFIVGEKRHPLSSN